MRNLVRYGCAVSLLMLAFLLAGCVERSSTRDCPTGDCPTDDGDGVKALADYSFVVHTRGTDTSAPDETKQYTRLYVAERLQEHGADHLHCATGRRYTLTGGSYSLTDLYGQWYKFAFVCVPQWDGGGGETLLTEETPVDKTCDFNKLLVDFNPVLTYQKENANIAQTADLNVYRQVIDRWIDPDVDNEDDVEMTRITGELLIDMGIPADQFPRDVQYFKLTLNNPAVKVYVRDGSNDEVTTVAGSADVVYTLDFSGLSDEVYRQAMATRQVFRLCLLPEVLTGNVTVKYKNSNSSVTLPIGSNTANGETLVEVRKNRVTTVLYNGMQKNEFEVRYAGFATGSDAAVDVDDDEWNGWE